MKLRTDGWLVLFCASRYRGGSCLGVAFRVAGELRDATLAYLRG